MTAPLFLCASVVAALVACGLVCGSLRKQRLANRLRKIGAADFEPGQQMPMWQAVLTTSSHTLLRSSMRRGLADKLAQAGMYESWHIDAFLLFRFLLIAAAVVGGFFLFEVDLASVFRHPLPFFKWLILVAVAGRIPGWWLKDRTNMNRRKIIASVPQAVDFMTICVESGLSLEDAFDKVGQEMRKTAPEVASEMRITRSEMLMLDRTRALQRMKKRSGVREMENLADALLQSIRFGSPLVDTLQSIASESRAGQISSLEEQAGVISARVGVPLILFVLFPLVVLLAAPAMVQFVRTL